MTLSRSGALAALAAASCLLVWAPGARALIQVQRGISGITVGMSEAQVKAGLGRPAKTHKGQSTFGPFTQYVYAGGLTVSFQGNAKVTQVAITGSTDRTARNVGVGSTEAAVKRGVHGVKCETIVGTRSCHVGPFRPGARVTDFLITRGRVSRVTVGLVID